MRKIRMTVEYDGTDFAGFQTQADGIRTVQQTLESAIAAIAGNAPVVHGAGRTDAGVHALGQVVHFGTESPLSAQVFERALNATLPRDVSVRCASDAEAGFHARFSAVHRSYTYALLNRSARSAIWDRYSLHEPRELDVAAMKAAGAALVGEHDFSAFANAVGVGAGVSRVRLIHRVRVRRVRGADLILIQVGANGFLRSMVRNIVGGLIAVGRRAAQPADVERVLESRDRASNPWPTAPARGLCLYKVEYGGQGAGDRRGKIGKSDR